MLILESNNSKESELEKWKIRHERMFFIDGYILGACYSLLGIVGIVTLVWLCTKKKYRTDFFFIALTMLITVSGLGEAPIYFSAEPPDWVWKIATISDISGNIVHWIFPLLIFKTALNVSVLFGEENIEQ